MSKLQESKTLNNGVNGMIELSLAQKKTTSVSALAKQNGDSPTKKNIFQADRCVFNREFVKLKMVKRIMNEERVKVRQKHRSTMSKRQRDRENREFGIFPETYK